MNNIQLLSQAAIFSTLNQAQLQEIVTWFREDHFETDQYLFHENDPVSRFCLVKSGQVKIIKYGSNGKEVVIEVIPPGEIFGGATMLMHSHPATAQALSPLVTLSLSVDEYKKMLQVYPDVAIHIIETLGERMLGVIRTRVMLNERVERRIAHIFLKLVDKCGVPVEAGAVKINLSLTRQDIADLADTSLETAIRVMSRFRKDGLIKTQRGGYIHLLDLEQIGQISRDDPNGR